MKVFFLIAGLMFSGVDANAQSPCASLEGSFRSDSRSLTITFDEATSLVNLSYGTGNQTPRSYRIIADGRKHSGDRDVTGNTYVANCEVNMLAVDASFDMADLHQEWVLEGKILSVYSAMSGYAKQLVGTWEKQE